MDPKSPCEYAALGAAVTAGLPTAPPATRTGTPAAPEKRMHAE
ncbi:hypothetical protein ABT278_37670 [Streptomyces sp. NPDC001228]